MVNIFPSKLYRPGSVDYVSKSGGMSNELNNILSFTNGAHEGITTCGDSYPGSTFIDHLLQYGRDPDTLVLWQTQIWRLRKQRIAMEAAGFVVSDTFEELPHVSKRSLLPTA